MRLFGREWGGKFLGSDILKDITNAFNKSFYEFLGGQDAEYDHKRTTYLEKGYGLNPDVYAVISQQAEKINSIPYYINKVKDKKSKYKLKQLQNATNGNLSLPQIKRQIELKAKAFDNNDLPMPLENPNPNQTWGEIFALYQVFMQSTGNFYLYMVKPEDGVNAGVPSQVYVLPSHLIKIVIKENADLIENENVIDHYMLTEGNQYLTFDTDDVIHIKLPNPFFDFKGSHLYGMSPIRVLLKNLESSNDALSQNVKTMKNGGVFGFIHSKEGNTMTAEQATQLKEKIKEMDSNPSRLSHIAGSSVPLAFTKISLDTDELKPFDFLKYDQKTICNVLGWSDKLLNNDDGAKYDNLNIIQKSVILNHIIPRLNLLAEGLNKSFIPLFKGYEKAEIDWDYKELPEMQEDVLALVTAYSKAPVTPNELRLILEFERLDIDGMDSVFIDGNQKRVDETGLSDFELNEAFRE